MTQTPQTPKEGTLLLGPFVGNITHSSVKIWLNVQAADSDRDVFVTLEFIDQYSKSEVSQQQAKAAVAPEKPQTEAPRPGVVHCLKENLGTGTVALSGLKPNAKYSYKLWEDEARTTALDLRGLEQEHLWFITLPEEGYDKQLDFLLMSCHNPETAIADECEGFAVWRQLPEIMDRNANVRFAILAGDQIYADDVEAQVLKERDSEERRRLYLSIYKKFWDNIHYRRVLCRLPSVLMWDDHDITDGWGSREDSFETKDSGKFRDDWLDLFGTAREMFQIMQASRNPDPLSKDFADGFDACFKVGRAGFVVADLRSNRNIRYSRGIRDGKEAWIGRIWRPEQLQAIKNWIQANKKDLDTLFFVSSVVFSHGAPVVERYILKVWFWVIDRVNWLMGAGLLKKQLQWFNDKVGDLRDDINDSWGSDANQEEADRALDYFFELQNPADGGKRLNVVILSGDIHTPGYSTIYSSAKKDYEKKLIPGGEFEGRAIIPHIVATPVSYEPFSWLGEAIFRHLTKVVELGEKGIYTSQVSHHFCYRNIVVVSLRNYGKDEDESHLKVKYYLEGYPEPQIMLFDLNHGAHREAIGWPPTVKPKSFWDELLFWRKSKQPARTPNSEISNIPPTPLDIPEPIPK